MNKHKIEKPFRVKLYDGYEHQWIDLDSEHNFDNETDAIKKRDELQKQIQPGSLDHYGVIKMTTEERGYEISCVHN